MNLEDWPSLRLVIPLIAGIIISDTILNTRAQVPVWCILALIAVLIILILTYSDSKPRLSGLLLSLSFVLAGAFSYQREIQRVSVDWPERWVIYHGVINTYPLERERTYRLEVTLTDSLYKDITIYLYLPKDSLAMSLEPGQTITFDGKINKPSSEGAGFDYASYLLSHGISGTLRVQAKDWHSDPPKGRLSIKIRSVRFRKSIIRKYMEWGLKGNALAVASAVSLGEKKQIDESLREIYSTSGVSHVLAVSGLHVGIMCWFLYLIFPSFIFRKQMWIREIMVLGILWAYAFAIGLPVSITRSLIMFSIVAICRGIDKENSALNSLGIAALLMLAVNPSALFDMSFQLSFSAVFFIVVLTPLLLDFYKPLTAPVRYVWRVSVLSFSAQIGTTPIVMYHFSGFSTYVLLANLFVVPAMFVVVALSMSLWIIGWIPLLRVPVVNVLTWMIDTLTRMLTFVSSLPYAHVELSLSNGWNILVIYAVVLFIFLWLKEKRTHRLVQALACVAFSSVLAMIQKFVV
ncbi:MAG: ComEC/Rec2 family competence protein [Bacteroidaceae bacterium]